MVTEREQVSIDLDQIANVAKIGVRRAALFMGLGLHAANREDFQDYELNKLPANSRATAPTIEILPSGATPAQIKNFKREFSVWIIGGGLREILEHFGLFLDQVHSAALFILHNRGLNNLGDPEILRKNFHGRAGIGEKLRLIEERFSIVLPHTAYINSMYLARNCLTHRMGEVAAQDLKGKESLVVSWLAPDVFLRGEVSGKITPYPELIGKVTTEESMVCMKIVERSREFKLGERLELTQQDLWEICFSFNSFFVPEMLRLVVEFMKAHNVPIETGKNSPA